MITIPPRTRQHKAKAVGPKARQKYGSKEIYGEFTPRSNGAFKATTGPNKGKRVAKRDFKKDQRNKAKTVTKPGYRYRGDSRKGRRQ